MHKTNRKRILSAILAAAILLSLVSVTGLSVGTEEPQQTQQTQQTQPPVSSVQPLPEDHDTLKITVDGQQADSLELLPHEKIDITAAGLDEEATYQWQIRHPETGAWINIYDATEQRLSVSAALVKNMLSEDGTAALRCRAYTEEYAYLSNSIQVVMVEESAAPVTLASPAAFTMLGRAVPLADEPPEFVTVTIQYVRYDFLKDSRGNLIYTDVDGNGAYSEGDTLTYNDGVQAFSPYRATLVYNHPLNTEVEFPTLVGYDSYLNDVKTNTITINLPAVTEDTVYTVQYRPKMVDFKIRYFFQNIYDDLYVEDYSKQYDGLVSQGKGAYTGSIPYTELLEKEFDGFTALYHQPDTIAADGSTVFEVYYERNYYLMEFDCNGGYGTSTLYNRYGSFVSVPNPVQMGHVFGKNGDGNGWDLVKTENPANTEELGTPILDGSGNPTGLYTGDGNGNTLPITMPTYNSAYKAIWDEIETVYSVVYWLKTSTGTTYLGHRQENAMSNSQVSGSDDINADGVYICGETAHTHASCILVCNAEAHNHSISCYGANNGYTQATNSNTGYSVISQIKDPQEGYVYRYRQDNWRGQASYYNYFYDGTTWYYLGSDTQYRGLIAAVANPNSSGGYNSAQSTRVISCGKTEHTHDGNCYNCGQITHTHTEICHGLSAYCEYVGADGPADGIGTENPVTVSGDGSTVVNVYYRYKTYTIRFIYARTNTSGGSIYLASSTGCGQYNNIQSNSVDHNGATAGNDHHNVNWNYSVNALPSITDEYYQDPTRNGYFEDKDANGTTYRYYYIALTAQYGSDLTDVWPSSSIGRGGTGYYFGSWGAECASLYRANYGSEHANIVGPYPVMSEEMMVSGRTTKLDDGTYLAQDMVAWWGQSKDNITTHAYHNYFELLPGEKEEADKIYTTYNGKRYKLVDNFTFTAAHNTNTRVDPVLYTGFDCINNTAGQTSDPQGNSSNFINNGNCPICGSTCNYCNTFYYDRTPHTLSFYNYNDSSDSFPDTTVLYGLSLKDFKPTEDPPYPSGIEPNAYEFKGWYTTPECFENTDVKWDSDTMPDGKLTVYAKWTPIIRNVIFYSAYSDIAADTNDTTDKVYHFMKADSVAHGTTLGSTYLDTPEHPDDLDPAITGGEQAETYDFVGWFYMDESNKKRFAPDSMKVTRNLVLFAEWQTSVDTTYEIEYVLRDAITDPNYTTDHTTHEAGAAVSDLLFAHASVGQTKTFEAPAGTALLPPFRKKFFPTVNSHSILMEHDSELNKYTFEYVYDDKVYYEIRYLEEGTGKVLATSKVTFSEEAIITEKFKPIDGYIPTSFYLTKTLQYDGDATAPIASNIFTFYYVLDSEHGIYTVEYYTENANSKDNTNLANYTRTEYTVGTGDLGATITGDKRDYVGFVCVPSMHTVVSYKDNGDVDQTRVGSDETGDPPKGTVTNAGLVIRLYYKRIPYAYKIVCREYETEEILSSVIMPVTGADTKDPSYRFESEVSETAADTLVYNGQTYYLHVTAEKPKTQSLEIRTETNNADPTANVITFYYALRNYTVNYKAICTVPDVPDFGIVSPNYQQGTSINKISGAVAVAGAGFRFVEWQKVIDENVIVDGVHTQREKITAAGWVNDTQLTPKDFEDDLNDDGIITYYALFEPVTSRLTITKNVTGTERADTFLFNIRGLGKNSYIDITVAISGNGSAVIDHIPIGEYQVTELTDWSKQYSLVNVSPADGKITVTTAPASITFTNNYEGSDWLTGEHSIINRFPPKS